MTFKELRLAYNAGKIEKKLYWQLVREQYTSVLAQIQDVVKDNSEVLNICINKNGGVLTNANGMKHYFFFDETFCRAEAELCGNGDYEKADIDVIVKYLQKTGDKEVFDVGANAGLFSLNLFYELLEDSKVHYTLFEPLPTTFEKMQMNLKLNNVSTSFFRTENLGLSDREGSFDFYLPGASEAASLEPINDGFYLKNSDPDGNYTGLTQMQKVKCGVSTLDKYVEKNQVSRIDFLKIDVEGNEKFVLKGAEQTLNRFHPFVYCELLRKHSKRFGYHPNEVIEFMKELGYSCHTIHSGRLTEIQKIDEGTVETNFFFATNEQRNIIYEGCFSK